MKILKIESGNKISVAQTDLVDLAPWELRISVALSCICGSDIKSIASPKFENQTPGHEFSGIVSELSDQAADVFEVGERVTVFPIMPCHSCNSCNIGDYRDCESKKSIGFDLQGSFAEELVVDSRMTIPLPTEISMSQGALLEHLSCGFRLAEDISDNEVRSDARIVILGDGPIALANLRMLVLRGYWNVSVYGKHPFRLQYALTSGAHTAIDINAMDSLSDNDGEFIDICIVSSPADLLLRKLLEKLGPGSKIFEQTRISNPDLRKILILSGATLFRAFAYKFGDFAEVIKLIIRGDIDTSKLITSSFNLEEAAMAYPSLLKKDKNIKVAVISNMNLLDV